IPVIQNFFEEFRNGEGAGGQLRGILEAVGNAAKATFGWLRDEGLPALQGIWEFVSTKLWPDLKAAFIDSIIPAVKEMARTFMDFWENGAKPTLNALWKFIKDVLAPFLV